MMADKGRTNPDKTGSGAAKLLILWADTFRKVVRRTCCPHRVRKGHGKAAYMTDKKPLTRTDIVSGHSTFDRGGQNPPSLKGGLPTVRPGRKTEQQNRKRKPTSGASQCLRTGRVWGPCKVCGKPVEPIAHVALNETAGLYCQGCCPNCGCERRAA